MDLKYALIILSVVVVLVVLFYFYKKENYDIRHHALIQRGLHTTNSDYDSSMILLDGLEKIY